MKSCRDRMHIPWDKREVFRDQPPIPISEFNTSGRLFAGYPPYMIMANLL